MIQLIGRAGCRETRKAERFLRERRIDFHFVDLDKRNLSQGEFKKIADSVGLDNLIDTNSKQFEKRGLKYMDYDLSEELFSDQKLIKTPVVRFNNSAKAGYDESVYQEIMLSVSSDIKKTKQEFDE